MIEAEEVQEHPEPEQDVGPEDEICWQIQASASKCRGFFCDLSATKFSASRGLID